MARDASGTYTAPTNSFNPAVEGATIDESAWNTTLDDLEAGLTDSLSISGKGKVTAHVDFDEISSPSSPASNVGRLYVQDVGGVTTLKFKDAGGTDYNLLLTSPGLAYTFSTSTTTSSDPGSGSIRFNNATLSSVTEIAIDDNDANGADLSAYILTWDDQTGTARGNLIIQNRTSPANVVVFRISGASTDETGWTRLSVTYVTHNGSFAASAPLGVTFAPSGATGLDGVSAGLLYQFSTSTTTGSDPGAGYVRFNNATLASVTEIAVDDASANSGNPDVSAFVLTWDDSTSTIRGTVTFKKATALQNYAIFNVTGASTDEIGWTRLAVTYVGHSGSFSNNDQLGLEFVRTGDVSTTAGPSGSNGTDPGIRWLFDSSTTTAADPGSGDFRLDNATLASVTEISVSYSSGESGNPSVETFVKSWDDSTTTSLRGTLIVKKASAPQNFAIYSITSAITDGTTYGRFTLSHVSSSGSFSNGDTMAVQFLRTGNSGAGSGDVVGPASSTNNSLARFDGTTGKLLKDGAVIGTDVQAYDADLASWASVTRASGFDTFAATPSSANLAAMLTDETGSGANVHATSPTLVTPVLGVATATSINKVALTAPATASTLTIEDGKVLTVSNSITLAGTDSTTMTFPSSSSTIRAAGKETIWIPAAAMTARTTNGAAAGTTEMTTNKNMFSTLDYDATTQEFAQFEIHMPKSWNLSTVTFQPVWSHAATSTNFGVVWELAAVARSDDDAGDVAFGTAQSSTDTGGTTNDIYIGPESSAITVAGTPAAGDTVQYQLARAPANGSDTMAIDGRLHGIRLFFTTNASTDA